MQLQAEFTFNWSKIIWNQRRPIFVHNIQHKQHQNV